MKSHQPSRRRYHLSYNVLGGVLLPLLVILAVAIVNACRLNSRDLSQQEGHKHRTGIGDTQRQKSTAKTTTQTKPDLHQIRDQDTRRGSNARPGRRLLKVIRY